MFIAPDKKIRKYVAFSQEEHKWIHDPEMPEEYEEEFKRFVELAGESKGLVLSEEDSYESMLDKYVDDLGDMDRNKAEEEYAHHKSVINQIENAQKMRVEDYTQKVRRIDSEVESILKDYPGMEATDISYLKVLPEEDDCK